MAISDKNKNTMPCGEAHRSVSPIVTQGGTPPGRGESKGPQCLNVTIAQIPGQGSSAYTSQYHPSPADENTLQTQSRKHLTTNVFHLTTNGSKAAAGHKHQAT